MRHRVALSLTVTALLAAFARPAAACWDGFHGETERVRIVGYSDGTWSYAEARRMMVEKSAQARIPESAAERLGASAAGTNAFLRSANAGARPRL